MDWTSGYFPLIANQVMASLFNALDPIRQLTERILERCVGCELNTAARQAPVLDSLNMAPGKPS